ncbi:MAG: tetratricopeptide repeat protein [Planctomycetes bacterium]|nr:tetratricopeptide repeat protein [Planctomycetota bacterium]
MDTHPYHSQRQSANTRNRNVSAILIGVAIWLFSNPAISAAGESTARQQAAGFLKDQISAVSKQLLKDFPEDAETIKSATIFHRQCNTPGKAMKVLEKGLKYNPRNAELCDLMGQIAFEMGEYDKAITYWEKALKVSPSWLNLNNNIADAMLSSGKNSEAVKQLEESIANKNFKALPAPYRSRSYFLLGQGYMQLGKYEEAKNHYEKALKINPKYRRGNYWLGKVYLRLKQPVKAKQHMQIHRKQLTAKADRRSDLAEKNKLAVIDMSSNVELKAFPEIMAGLCLRGSELYGAHNKTKKSEKLLAQGKEALRKAITIYSKQSDIYRELGFLYLVTNSNLSDARELAEKAVALEGSAKNYFVLSLICDRNFDRTNAIIAIRKALELEPGNGMYRQKYNEMKKRKR